MSMLLTVFDLLSLLAVLSALWLAAARRIAGLRRDYLWCLIILLVVLGLNFLSNLLDNSGLSPWLERFEDYPGLLQPVFWGILLMSLVQDRALRRTELSEQRLRGLLDAMRDGVATIDPGGVFRFANPAAAEILGVAHGSLSGRSLDEFWLATESHTCRMLPHSPGQDYSAYECGIRHGSGDSLVLLLQVSPIPGQPRQRLLFMHDVTPLRRAEHSLQQAQAQLGQAQRLEAIGTLASGIAHDFNNILFAISGNSQIALDTEGLTVDARESLREIDTASRRASDLVAQILNFSRSEKSRTRDLLPLPVVKEVLRLLRSTVPPQVSIQLSHDESTCRIHADPTDLHQLLMNLCTNAIQEMAVEGGTLRVRLECSNPPPTLAERGMLQPKPHLMLKVSDTGGGIPPDALPHIFEPFFTTKPSGEGTGLGLFVVSGIVKRLQGQIEIDSEPGHGSSFTVWLPLSSGAADADDAGPGQATGRGRGRLLVVDDEPAVNRVLALMLGQLGYKVTTYSDSYRALSEFQTNPEQYDLLLCDISMPGLRGDELVKRIRSVRPGLPVVLCSGNPDVLPPGSATELGVHAVLKKPVDKPQLADCIAEALGSNRAQA
ncbi:response regulator [bacterium]|nr:response regulator [bacterium]